MPRSARRRTIGLTFISLALVSVVVVLFSPLSPFRSNGTSPVSSVISAITGAADEVQQWVGRQLLAIANEHLGPTLAFERLDYLPPGTVVLTIVTLDAGATRMLQAEKIRVTLAETPKRGSPVVIQSVELVSPVIRIVQDEHGAFAGFDGFVTGSAGGVMDDGGSTRLTDVFDIRRIGIENAVVRYVQHGQPEMRFDGITASLETNPAHDREGRWYDMACTLGRSPLTQLALDGALELNTLQLALSAFDLNAELSPGHYEMFPPALQTALKEHEIRGAVRITGNGDVPLRALEDAALSMSCDLSDVRLRFGDYQIPLREGAITAAYAKQSLSVQTAKLHAYDGVIDLAGRVDFTSERTFGVTVSALNLNVEQFVTGSPDAVDTTKGVLDVDGRISGALAAADVSQRLAGDGTLNIRQAHLARIPVIDRLLQLMKTITAYGEPSDRGNAAFQLAGDRVHFTSFEFISQSIAARGEGDLHFDGTLDLIMNAGPLERIQGALGAIGDVFGKITDRLVSYRITGTLDKPQYEVRPLGVKVPFLGK